MEIVARAEIRNEMGGIENVKQNKENKQRIK